MAAIMNAPSSAMQSSLQAGESTLCLHQCPKNSTAQIVALLPQPLFGVQDERVTLRLKELGFLPGTLLTVIGFGLLGRDPIAVQINGTKFALRQSEAAKILLQKVDKHS